MQTANDAAPATCCTFRPPADTVFALGHHCVSAVNEHLPPRRELRHAVTNYSGRPIIFAANPNLSLRCHVSAKFQRWPMQGVAREFAQLGEQDMTRLVIDVVLFSCMFACVTGIVIAAANFLI
jgi:hypothetical protein